ncbi:T9SS type B sorting domain-containing protein [Flagellimonas lutaonensis]|nr:T9SS type B sorting domain-containing protein [Allomuricauda lutaonensis]
MNKWYFALFAILLLGFAENTFAQLSDLHYLPPLKQGRNNQAIRQQAVYLSTPEPTTFTVNAYRGTSTTPIASFNISNVSPAVYTLPNGDNNITLVNNANTGVVLNNSGLRFESPSGNRFYVNYRGYSSAQAASLTSKGRVAMGTRFKWGGVPNLGAHPSKSNTLGIMATEDNTTVTVYGYDPACRFRQGNNVYGITDDTYTITLDANESFVFEAYVGNSPTPAHRDGWIGASIESDKDIVISNGSLNFGRQENASNRDAGIDQPVPENRLGKEYVFVRGNGGTNGATEFPLIIATADNTQIFVNGNTTPIATIDNGEYFEIPSTFYSANSVGANMFVQTSKDVYAYQCMAGASQVYTQGLNFVAPVNCLLPDVMDNIPDIRNMAGTNVTGGVTIIAAVNTPDANITVTDGNGPVALPPSNPVAGSTDWKTFFIPNLNGDVSVQSTGPIAVGFFGYNGARGVAGYFSGFDTVPEVNLEIRGGSGCFVGSTIFEATGNFDAYQWFGDGQLIPRANGPSYAPTVAGDYYVRGTKGPCTYDSQPISAYYCDPDVVVNKTVDRPEIMEGETATFTIKVRNLGVGPLTNLQITDNIPAGLTLVSAFTITGSWSGNTWDIGTLNGGETAFLELEVRADEIDTLPLLSLTNTAINTQDQPDTNITVDNPSAHIIVHNDSDNDGVNDSTDLDDDNDGIYDQEECGTLFFNIANGNSHTSALVTNDNYLVLDIFSLDNSFNLQINGNDVAGEIQFQNTSGNIARFMDGTGYGESGNPNIWTLTGTYGTPILRVVIDQSGRFELFGARSSNGPLEPMVLTTPAATVSWNPVGNNAVVIGQAVIGPTNMRGMLLTAGCDTDADGIPDQLDLDSDGDGCSDANEFYKDDNADGGDGGEFGTGVPVVDAADGTVNSASYTRVFAPEILLGNTSEDLGGNDINGQGVNLGQTFNYVLRFQNTGDDNAVNYSIRDILPNNVTLDNIDVSNAPGVTHSYDINTNTIIFQVPDNLVEVDDPEYTIVITVTISANCTDFVDACSSQLQNQAYSTYQGVLNPSTFTDEGGATSTSACSVPPQVANNNILDDLANCNQARTVQLCGDDVVLSAGVGFTMYTWALDNNNDGQIDAGDTLLNDGDPDNDPSTLLVTDIGNYIVEKSAGSGCPDLVERITVERFGSTQTNPIIEYFNQVNGDGNPNNDLQGEVVTCSIDGDLLPKLFLCGENDSATIQLGITDAQSIVWQQLDEGSCSDVGDDCANKSGSCTWTDLATQDNYTLTDSGSYRVVINYQNGCFSRFYFNVFKNNLDIEHTASDILCSTPGNIRITNIGSGYGFQLIDASNNSVVVPFSADNGPSFDITASGTYRVQVTQLDPITNDPIVGSCVFETEDIGILERDYQVNLSSTPAECDELGTITVQALNVLPNYSYELRLDDGSNGGQGTFVANETATNDNTHTFANVNPGNYIVITTTDDGCTNTQNITVGEVAELRLSAITTDHITCNAGVITLTPQGGSPNPDYEMAIWAKDGVPLYTDPNDVPDTAKQNTTNFLFGYRGTPETYFPNEEGDYQFIVFDGNGCSALSNIVNIQDLGTVSIAASHTDIVCSDSSTSTLTVTATGGTAPYQYSLDGGTSYQTENTFVNLPAGRYTITVMDSSGTPTSRCIETLDYEIDQPFRLTASAAIVEDASCNPNGALVKILNPNGGQGPYEYSFDGGSSFSANDQRNLLPGNYQLVVRDALGCTFDMDLAVPTPAPDPNFDSNVVYACDGSGSITISPSNTTDFDYTYTLNGTENTPADNNVFPNVTDGTHTVTVAYASSLLPDQSTLFFEDFGAGTTTQIGEIGPDYCYEPQDGSITPCNRGPAGILVNGEYTVTNFVTNPITLWTSPQDHTGLVDGRFLAIDISTFSDTGNPQLNNILWARRNIEVLPNKEVTLRFWAYNLMNVGGAGNNPEVRVEILDNTGTVIYSEVAPEIPKNTNDTDWHERIITFYPGANTDIDIVFRTNVNSNDGNDLVLDDITAFQMPDVCEKTQDLTVVVEAGQAFSAQLLGVNDPSCQGASDGSIRFEVSNFDPTIGFEYSLDGGTNWTTSLTSPVITANNLADGSYTVQVRKVDDTACTASFSATLNEPTVIMPLLNQTADYTCFNTGATLEASATGGTPGYEYQLEDTSANIVRPYQSAPTFTNVPDGGYLVRVRDANGCEEISTTPVTVVEPETITFDLTATACYDGQNNASVTATVTTGNGGYTFRINGGAWLTPTPASDTTYTFTGLSDGLYTIEVSDAYGCISNPQDITIHPPLLGQMDVVDVSSCADGSITVNATGGNNGYVYAFLNTGNTVQDSDFGASNMFTVTNATAGTYDVYVRDNGGTSPYCQYMETLTVQNSPALAFTATPTDAECYGGTGSIAVNISNGLAPYTYELVDIDNGVANQTQTSVVAMSITYYNLLAGQYDVIITDANGCATTTSGIVVAAPDELTADISGITPATCTGDVNDFGFGFSNYPTTLGTIEFSADGGANWIGDNSVPGTTDQLTGYLSGSTVYPSMRTVDGSGNTVCQTDFPPFIIPYPLDDLDITVLPIIVNCNELQVTVRGQNGTAPYEYTYSEDPANFNPAAPANGWTPPLASGVTHTFPGLTPGRTYAFYVRDAVGCIRQSNVNVNDVVTNPMEITAAYEPSCNGANNGEITYTITDDDGLTEPDMRWTLYDINDNPITSSGGDVPYTSTITIPNLAPNEYYIVVEQVNGGTVQCTSASENLILEELDPITANLNVLQHITCEGPGLISIDNIQGGGGTYSYTITGPAPFSTISGTTDNPVSIPANSPAGSYAVSISDQYGCAYSLGSVNMNLAANPTITAVDVDNCSSLATVTVTASGASPTLYSLDGGTTYQDNGGVFNNVIAGSYTLFVKDGNGCTASQTVNVETTLEVTATLTKNLGCGAGNEAEIRIEVTSGSNNYDYEIVGTSGTLVPRQALASNPLSVPVATADTYTVTVYDNNTNSPECNRNFIIEIPAATSPHFSADATDVSCFGATDGTISITEINNGNNPLSYVLSPNNGTFNAATNSYENLPADTYQITATGPNGCTTISPPIVVGEPNEITFNMPSVTPFDCSTGNNTVNASITVDIGSITGGSNNYIRYEFIDNATSSVLQNGTAHNYIYTDFAGGDVIVRVYDDNGCSGEVTVTVPAYDQLLSASIHVDEDISCSNAGEDISIDAVGSLTSYGTHPANYEFRMLPSGSYQASNQFFDLVPGNYTFGIRNTITGCELTITHVVEEPNTFDVTVEKLSDAVCFGDDGSIRLTLIDATYTGGFSWQIFDTNGTPADRSDDGAAILSGNSVNLGPTAAISVPAGNYLVEMVQDAFPECSQVRSFSIATPSAPISLNAIDLTDVGCTNDQGAAAINPTGGQAPYTIDLTHVGNNNTTTVSNVNAHLFQSLVAGQYTITVTDALGCTEIFTNAFELLLPDPITGTVHHTNLVCKGDSDASVSISLSPRNLSAAYRYILNTYNDAAGSVLLASSTSQTSATFDNLGAGFYTIAALDDMGCSFETPVVEIVEPTEVTAQLLTQQVLSCQRGAELLLQASGGTAPYSWSVDGTTFTPMNEVNGANTHLFTNVAADAYQYYVRDSFNCVSILSNEIQVNTVQDLTLTVDQSAAFVNCSGDSTAIIESSATGGLGDYQYALFGDPALTDEIVPNQPNGLFTDLPQGSYYVRVQSDDCETISEEIIIQEPTPLVVDTNISNISCNGAEDGSIVLNVQGGVGPYQFAISPNLNQFVDENSFNGLAPGDYTVIAQDANGCFEVVSFSLAEPNELSLTTTVLDEICFESSDGAITLQINGGTAPYFTSLNSNNDADFAEGVLEYNNLPSGTHVVFVRDANGCELSEVFEVASGANLAGEAVVSYPCDSGVATNSVSIAFEDDTVSGEVLYGLDTTDPAEMVLDGTFENLAGGDHFITVVHSNGCTNTFEFTITEFEPLELQLTEGDINTIEALAFGGSGNYTFNFDGGDFSEDPSHYITETATYSVTVTDENGCSVTEEIFMEFIDIEIPNFFTPDGDGNNDVWRPRNIEQYPNIFIKIYDRYGRTLYHFEGNHDGWNGQYQLTDLPSGDYWYIIKLNGVQDTREFIGHFTLYR